MAEYEYDDGICASHSEDDEFPYSHKGYGGHSGGSRGYELSRRSQTYSGNPGNRRSGGARSHRTTSYNLDEDDLDDGSDRRLQLSRRDGTDLSNRGNGHFGREAPSRRPTYHAEPAYYDGVYRQEYSPCNERYPPDIGYNFRSRALGDNFNINGDVKFIEHKHYHYDGPPAHQKEWSDRKDREAYRDTPPPPVKKSGNKGKYMGEVGKKFVEEAIKYGFKNLPNR